MARDASDAGYTCASAVIAMINSAVSAIYSLPAGVLVRMCMATCPSACAPSPRADALGLSCRLRGLAAAFVLVSMAAMPGVAGSTFALEVVSVERRQLGCACRRLKCR